MGLLGGAAVALLALAVLLALARRLGGQGFESSAKGLGALQTIFALMGIVLVAEWYVVEEPDAARLKFDQSVSGIRLDNGKRSLVTIEVTVTDVGGHPAIFKNGSYQIYVQRVSPLPDEVSKQNIPAPNGLARVLRADDWESMAYRAVGEPPVPNYPNWDACGPSTRPGTCEDGLDMVIEPSETENLYFLAILPCTPGLHVAVTSRFRAPKEWYELFDTQPNDWIKQSFLDLTDACRAQEPISAEKRK